MVGHPPCCYGPGFNATLLISRGKSKQIIKIENKHPNTHTQKMTVCMHFYRQAVTLILAVICGTVTRICHNRGYFLVCAVSLSVSTLVELGERIHYEISECVGVFLEIKVQKYSSLPTFLRTDYR